MTISPPDNLIQQPTRYAVMAYLARAVGGVASFMDVCRAVGIENLGHLSTHGQLLEEVGYIKFRKSFEGRRPHTVLVLTVKGRTAFAKHKAKLDAMSSPTALVEATA
jgi:DNA-binding MarR family transcriptional regulator